MSSENLRDTVTSLVGEGVHTGLRKFTDAPTSHTAWVAIKDLPNDHWHGICEIVTDQILSHLKSQIEQIVNPHFTIGSHKAFEQCRKAILSKLQ